MAGIVYVVVGSYLLGIDEEYTLIHLRLDSDQSAIYKSNNPLFIKE